MSEVDSYPRVSVVIPTYNSGPVLLESIRSALDQCYPNLEVVVIDDGSTDGTRERIQPLADSICYHWQENGGLAAARTTGHRIATGQYIAWLDADDIAHPDRVKIQAAYLRKHPEVVLVASEFSSFSEAGPVPDDNRSYYSVLERGMDYELLYGKKEEFEVDQRKYDVFVGDVRHELIFGNFIHPPTVMISRQAIDQAGDVSADDWSSDWLYFVQLSRYGQMAFIDQPLLRYRRSDNQRSSPKTHAKRIAVSNLKGMEKVMRLNPDLAELHKSRFRKIQARLNAQAADVFCEDQPLQAMTYLLRSVRGGYISIGQAKSLVKSLLPSFLLTAYRHRRDDEHRGEEKEPGTVTRNPA